MLGRSGLEHSAGGIGRSGTAAPAGGRDSKGSSGIDKGNSAHHATSQATIAMLHSEAEAEKFVEPAGDSGSFMNAQSSAIDSVSLPPVGFEIGGLPEVAPAVSFAGKPAVGAYAAAPFDVKAYADAEYSASHMPTAPADAPEACPTSVASNAGLAPGSQLVMGGGGGGAAGQRNTGTALPVPFSAESTRMTPAGVVQLLDLDDL